MSTTDHPEAEKLGWRIRNSRACFGNQIFRVREDVLLVSGKERRFAYVEKAPAVIVVPITPEGQMILVRQYRYPVDLHCMEVPAGTAADAGDLSFEELAAKELQEEVGAKAAQIEQVTSFFPSNALSNEKCHVFLAISVVLSEAPDPEPMEKIETQLVPAAEALTMARTGAMQTGPAALAVLMCEPRLRELGFVY